MTQHAATYDDGDAPIGGARRGCGEVGLRPAHQRVGKGVHFRPLKTVAAQARTDYGL